MSRRRHERDLAAQLRIWADSNPGTAQVAREIADQQIAMMPAHLSSDEEVAFLSALILELLERLRKVTAEAT